jgi:hypothetical protein
MSQVIQVVMLDVLQPDFELWLAGRGLRMDRLPVAEEEDGLPTYIISPREWADN